MQACIYGTPISARQQTRGLHSLASQFSTDGLMPVLSQCDRPSARMQTAGACPKRVCSCMSLFMIRGLGELSRIIPLCCLQGYSNSRWLTPFSSPLL